MYWVIQENSIEIPLQSSLPYILLPMVRAHYCAPYPKRPCVDHEANMCCPCCMTSLVLEPSTKFFYVLWSVLWLHHQVVTDVIAWPINPNPSCFKNRKYKNKSKRKIEMKWKEKKSSLPSSILTKEGSRRWRQGTCIQHGSLE